MDSFCKQYTKSKIKTCKLPNGSNTLNTLLSLLQNSMSVDMFHRHVTLIDEYLAISKNGNIITDLIPLMRCLELLVDRFDAVPAYKQPIKNLLILCGIPPLLTRTSDVTSRIVELAEYYTSLGSLLQSCTDPDVKLIIISSLECLLDKRNLNESGRITSEMCRTSLEESQLPETIGLLAELAPHFIYTDILNLASLLTKFSPKICQKLTKIGIIDNVLTYLIVSLDEDVYTLFRKDIQTDVSFKLGDRTVLLLWDLMRGLKQLSHKEIVTIQVPTLDTMRCLRYIWRMTCISKTQDRLRNDILGLLLMIFSIFENAFIFESMLAEDIISLSVASELDYDTDSSTTILASNEYLLFKKMLYLALCFCLKEEAGVKIGKERNVMRGVLLCINPLLEPVKLKWTNAQYLQLLVSALQVLALIVPLFPDEFIEEKGHIRLLLLIERFIVEPFDVEILYCTVKALFCNVICENKSLVENLKQSDTMSILTLLCHHFLDKQPHLTLVHQRIMCYAFYILEALFDNNECFQNEHCDRANELVVKYLNRTLKPRSDDMMTDDRLLITVCGFIWKAIVPVKRSLAIFAQKSGIYLMLDVIQNISYPANIIYLGALSDICSYDFCLPHIITWRGEKSMSIIPLLIKLFDYENIRMDVKKTGDGCIEDIEQPLMTNEQYFETFVAKKENYTSPALFDMIGSCRPKVYAILQALISYHQKTLRITDERHDLFTITDLSCKDKVTLFTARNFLCIKLGEMWREISEDVVKYDLKPLGINRQVLCALATQHINWASFLSDFQSNVFVDDKKEEENKERQLFNKLREWRLESALENLHHLKTKARVACREIRLEHKNIHKSQITSSTKYPIGVEEMYIHYTYMRRPDVTPVFDLCCTIDRAASSSNENTDDLF